MKFNKTKITIGVLLFLLIAATLYIASIFFVKYKNAAISLGYGLAIQDLMKEAENKECNYFPIYYKEQKVDLVNIKCLQQATSPTEASSEEGQQPDDAQ